jgi:2-polyprenyl-6-methoxyphenol hydroxylase-like FAD-dependent oxidoreductase
MTSQSTKKAEHASSKNILISGASVAGPALAYWLHRFGFNPTVVERSPELRGGGYAVDFRGAVHLGVLERMGILDEIRLHQTNLSALTYVDHEDRPLAKMPGEIFAGDVEILRGDLGRILYDATRHGTEYLFGDSVKTLEQNDDGVRVTFERSAPRTFDLVVGADGLHSNVRQLVFGDNSGVVKDLGLCVSTFSTTNFLDLDHAGLLYSTPGKTASIYSARDNTEAIAMLYFNTPALDYDHRDIRRQKEILAETFAGEGWHIPELLREMWQATDFYFDSTNQIHLERWSRGRVALIGDAGYAAGQGGNGTGNAVVAAYILAGELAAADGDDSAAFDRYELRLRDYVAGGQKQAAGAPAFLAPATWKKIRRRNRALKMLAYMPAKGFMKYVSTRTATAIKLPDYRPAPSNDAHAVDLRPDKTRSQPAQ